METVLVRRRIEYLLFIVVSLVPFIFIPIGEYNDFFYAPKYYGLTVIISIFLIFLLKSRNSLSSLIQPDLINFNLLCYFLLLVISLFFALNLDLAVNGRIYRKEGFITLIIYFLLFLAARTIKIPKNKFFLGITISATILSIYGIAQFYGFDPFPRDFIRQDWQLTFSTFGNPDFFGSYLVLVIPIIIHSFIKDKKNISGVVYVILLCALLCTYARGAWIGAAFAVCVYLIINRRFSSNYKQDLKRILYAAIITAFVILGFNILSNSAFMNEFISIFTDFNKLFRGGEEIGAAGSHRIFIWKGVISLIKDRPIFGYGIENLMEPFVERYGSYVDMAHNEYLHIAVTTGIPSLIVFLSFIIQVLHKSIENLKQNEIYFPFAAAVLGYLTQAFFNNSVVSVAYIFWIFLGIISPYQYKRTQQ